MSTCQLNRWTLRCLLVVVVAATGCGPTPLDSDLQTEAEPGDPDKPDTPERVAVAVGARHLVGLDAEYRLKDFSFSEPETVDVVDGGVTDRGVEFRCEYSGLTTLSLTVETRAGESAPSADVEIDCLDVTRVEFFPEGRLSNQPYFSDRIVSVEQNFDLLFELYHEETQLAGYNYNPFGSVTSRDGVEIDVEPMDLRTGQEADHRRVHIRSLTTEQSIDLTTVTDHSVTLENIKEQELDDVSIRIPIPAENTLKPGDEIPMDQVVIFTLDGMSDGDRVIGRECHVEVQTTDVCEVVSMTGERPSCSLGLNNKKPGTCRFEASLSNTGVTEEFSFELVDK